LRRWGFVHDRVKHLEGVYVRGSVGTNTIEGFWSHVKTGIRGVYKHVSRKHLQGYLNEYTFRYNHRDDGRPMFKILKARISQEFLALHFPEKHRPPKIDA